MEFDLIQLFSKKSTQTQVLSYLKQTTNRNEQLQMLLMISLCDLIIKKGESLIEGYEKQTTSKRTGKRGQLNRPTIHTFSVGPTPFLIVLQRNTNHFYESLKNQCMQYLNSLLKTDKVKKILALSIQTSYVQQQKNIKKKMMKNKRGKLTFGSKQNWLQKTERVLQKKKHRRFKSDFSQYKIKKRQQMDDQAIKKRNQHFLSRKKQQMRFFNKNEVKFSSGQSIGKALVQTINIFLSNLLKANYLMGCWISKGGKEKDVLVYLSHLITNFNKIIVVVKTIQSRLNLKFECACQQVTNQSERLNYLNLSEQIIQRIKNLSLNPKFEQNFELIGKQGCELIRLLFSGRYYLRYLQKQIENKDISCKKVKQVEKWKQAYRIKFMGRTVR